MANDDMHCLSAIMSNLSSNVNQLSANMTGQRSINTHLPKFSGSPENVNHFLVNYNNIALVNGYSDLQKTALLAQSLKGRSLFGIYHNSWWRCGVNINPPKTLPSR